VAPLAEWWYNTTFHSSIKATPYKVVYGQSPPIHLPYLLGESTTVNRTLVAREEVLKLLKFHLLQAQNRTSQQAHKHRNDKVFSIGDFF
jgi:hypothetical protein